MIKRNRNVPNKFTDRCRISNSPKYHNLGRVLIIALMTIFFIGCNSEKNANKDTTLDPQVSAFDANLHPVLVDRCGHCHAGGKSEPAGTPDFAHEDVATAYSVVMSETLVNLDNSESSRLVKKVLAFHQCSRFTCNTWADEIQTGIEDWANDIAEEDDINVNNETDGQDEVDGTVQAELLDSQITAFSSDLHPVLINRCGSCHSGSADEPEETPNFAHQDATAAYSVLTSNNLINLTDTADSRLIEKVLSMHKCFQPACDSWADEIQTGIDKLASTVPVNNGTQEPDESDGMNGTDEMDVTEQDTMLESQIIAFSDNLQPVLLERCSLCHAGLEDDPAGTPDFAHQDAATAYSVITSNTLVNLGNPANSRLVKKILTLHKCTQPTCDSWAGEIQTGVEGWANALADTSTGTGMSGTRIVSKPLTLAQGIKDEGMGRVEDAIIAKYEFKTGSGQTALDTSGVAPTLDLTLSADVNWIPARGIEITDPNATEVSKAVGTAADSKKLFDKIAGPDGSKQYSIEAWIINDNTAIDGPARIVSYSQNAQNRNFTMGQDTSYYNFRNRSDMTGANGSSPALESDNDAGDLKPQLQHVVFTFDTTNGRNIYVNGNKTVYERVESDPAVPADISNWNDGYTFVLGNEVSNNVKRQWLGKMLFVGIHDRALTAEEVLQNALEGIGDKYILEFDISESLDTSGNTTSKISLVVSELDEYSYVFGTPTLFTDIAVPNIPVKNIRIAVNDNVPAVAQTFRNVDMTVTSNDTELSSLAAVIPKDTGTETDNFSLVFEVLGNNSNVVIEQNPSPVPDMSVNETSPEYGVRTFAQINNTMAVLTGVDKSVTRETYEDIEQQLPGTPNLGSFVSANQIGIAKLSLEYCDALVENNTLRTSFFGSTFEFTSPVVTAFSNQEKRDIVISNLVNKMVGTNLSSQPSLMEVQPELDQLIDELSASCNVAADCDAARTRTIVKAACASVLASATVSIN